MEESEKRKERLKVMRMDAARAQSLDNPEALPGPSSLANPLIEMPGPPSVQEESRAAPRFDYYTDPMSAFSANRRRNNPGSQTQHNYMTPNHFPHSTAHLPSFSGARNFETSPSPQAYQWQASYSPNHEMYQPHAPQPNFAPYQSPRATSLPSLMHEGNPPRGWNSPSFHHPYNNAPNSGYSPNPSFRQSGTTFTPRHSSPHWHGNSPRATGPSFGRGRGQSSGYGSRGGGRGLGFRGSGSGSGRPMGPEQFFHESMIEDPWKDMVAVVWTPVGAHSTGSWMPQSVRDVRQKKPRVTEFPNKVSDGLNLAEFLAATFKEASNEAETSLET
ncbi:protein SICKLE [Punica granatum]|uniref:Protein SICKLE n=2 Tax=Punica granatum TaxID=22663 RepID=A0A6P8DGP4_PUNGR|nr:protein SICKLE [Punica granatum]XP_031392514.1 protein SICKLE [Punica granatum]XP_031392515.1 protein SICKLE [Punica granatum]XP_031392516.1 protein SICKLE [Punica granatum]OWM67707.1 hypothetical protein CDL15_Pgr019208 [Punica granatum]PKI73511.1 hypothetical protein CRG98_006092 [Punica granatum]